MGTGNAGDGFAKNTIATGGTVGIEIEFVVGVSIAALQARVEGYGDNSTICLLDCMNFYGNNVHPCYSAITEDNAWVVDSAIGGETVLVDATEMQIGICIVATGGIIQADGMCWLHVG